MQSKQFIEIASFFLFVYFCNKFNNTYRTYALIEYKHFMVYILNLQYNSFIPWFHPIFIFLII